MINRKEAPKIQMKKDLDVLKPDIVRLKNGIPVYMLDEGEQDVIKFEIVFEAGKWFQNKALIATTTNQMLREGTKSRKSEEIADSLDFMGSHIVPFCQPYHAGMSMFSLVRYFEKSLEIVADMIQNPVFPNHELSTYLAKQYQNFIIDQNKVEVLADHEFRKSLFGKQHPYGMIPESTAFTSIKTRNLVDFHHDHYFSGNCFIFMAGRIPSNCIDVLNKYLGYLPVNNSTAKQPADIPVTKSNERKIVITKKNAVQNAIKIGCHGISKKHPDFIPLQITNVFLGGYFGSRLMSNIREKKGYTYGIYSQITPMKKNSLFAISTTTSKEKTGKAIDEIYNELLKLSKQTTPEDEINRVKNYLTGELLRTFDGPFSKLSALKSMILEDLGLDFYRNFLTAVQQTNTTLIQQTAEKHLSEENMFEVIAGEYL